MSAGTLTLTNNSSAVGGTGTTFTTELASGDFVVVTVGGVPYTLPVKAVNSNTSLTLVSNFTGPTQSGAAWSAVPRVALNMVTAALVAQSAEALRGLNYDKQNWQQVFSASGTFTVKLPDGSSFTGPSWNSFTTELAKKVNSTDLGSAASKNVGTASGNVMQVGAFGIGATNPDKSSGNSAGFISEGSGSSAWAPSTGAGVQSGYNTNRMCQMFIANNGTLYARFNTSGDAFASPASQPWIKHYSTANTTTSSDGTLKAASPVARVVRSKEDNQRTDVAENGFIWCGCGTSNEEAEGISISRLDTGVYVLTGSAGLASEGWQLLPPMDPAGMGELGVVEAEETESGGITIRLFKRKYMLSNEGEIVKTKGEPMDVPANSWIDVRLDMPGNSVWKKRQAEANKILEISDMENQQDSVAMNANVLSPR